MKQKTIIAIIVIAILFVMSITSLIVNINQTKVNEAQQVQINKLIKENKELTAINKELTTRLDSDELVLLDILDLIEAQNEYMFLWL